MATYTKRDREVAHEIHQLFWRARLQDLPSFLIWCVTRPLAMFISFVIVPYVVAYSLQAIITKDFVSVPRYAIWLLVLAAAYCILWAVGGVAICNNGKKGMQYVQRQIFVNYLEKDYELLNNSFVGTLSAQATRLREALDEYNQIILNGFGKQTIIIVSSMVIIGSQSLLLAGITAVTMLLVLSFTFAITIWRLKYRRALSEASSETAGVLSDAISNGATVKSFAAETYEVNRLNRSLGKLAEVQYWSWITSIPADMGRTALAAIATFLLLIFTARLYQQEAISIAVVILVQLYVIRLVAVTQDIADLIKGYEATMSAAHQAVKTMLIKPTVLDKPRPKRLPRSTQRVIEFHTMSYRYSDAPANVWAVQDFSLEITAGKRVGLVGYSGSGKTTLTKLLLRFNDVSSGGITIDGIDIRELSQHQLRSQIAYVPQEPLLFHRSIKENIAYGKPEASEAEIMAVGKAAYVDEFSAELSNGYDTVVGEKGVKLSGGQRQRVAIARALLKNAPILVLDEATSALDSKSEQYIQKALWKLMKDRTALVIAHRLSTIQHMDSIVVMDKGAIVAVGTHQDLLKDTTGIYARLWSHQSGGYLVTNPEQD
jgi:ATP-binding cassette subfamily B protein